MIQEKLESIGGNRIVIALSSARLGDAIGNSILFVVLPLFVAKLPAPLFPWPETVRVGFLIAVFGLVNAFLEPLSGALVDRVGRGKPFIIAGLIIMALATLGFLVASHYIELLFLRVVQGVGVAMTVPAALVLMVGSSNKATRGGSMGIYTTSRMLGLGIGPLLGGFLYDSFGFDSTFYAGSAFIILAIILVNLWVDEPYPQKSNDKPEKFIIIDRNLLSTGILSVGFATMIMAADFSMMASLETQFNEKLGMSTFIFGLTFSAVLITRMFSQVPFGRYSDRIGRKPLIIAGMLLLVPSTALLGYADSTFTLILLRLLQGLASAAVAAPAFAIAGDMTRAGGEGRQMSIITMGFGLGVALGPLLAGVLAIDSFVLPFILGGGLSAVAAWIVYRFVPETVSRGELTHEISSITGK